MNREQVIEWAEKLAICSSAAHKEFLHEGLFKFAELVAASEREACAKVCEALQDFAELEKATKAAIDAAGTERELDRLRHQSDVILYNAGMRNCAAAIRARNTNKETQ